MADNPLNHSSDVLQSHEEKVQEVLGPEVTKQIQAVVMRQISVTASESHEGPLPRPQDFGQYDAVLPGSAERILRMAEKEQDHRHTMVGEEARQFSRAMEADITVVNRGQWFAFFVITVFVTLAVYCVVIGKNYAALAAVIVALGTGFGTHIMGRQVAAQPKASKPVDDADPKKELPEKATSDG